MSNTRLLAVKALLDIFGKGLKPKNSIENNSQNLEKRDRAFVMEIVYGVLRFRDTIDWILRHFLKNPERLDDFIVNNLRTAVYQIYFMRVPDWAVLNESVELEKGNGKPALVNAVLRNVLRQKENITLPVKSGLYDADISLNTSHPKWLIKRWIKRFGEKETESIAEANNKIPPFTIRVNTLKITKEKLISMLSERGIMSEPTAFSFDGIILKDISYDDISFAKGLFFVQDEASQLISYLLDPKPGEKILDACAAPGGKTTHIAQLMKDNGEILAVEKDPERIPMLKENIMNLDIKSVRIINSSLFELKDNEEFDRILVDSPCSATGVIRRNPDIKYKHRAKDLSEYGSKQKKLLLSASKHLRKNGTLVYSVCSTEPEEGEDVINEFLKTADDFRIIDTDVSFLDHFMNKGFFRTYPHKHNMDGFFGVKLCRKI
ncbi:MAG: 16S rRNA (cytosine(967)-C(5))-methyltransferase [Nitrospirae bacterium GWC2_42_7]|nr:MAG: 16S rRNA (cytosine(967)-C(5))-methyltransferase [Nitrospirae bacterium GWC2_42_7]